MAHFVKIENGLVTDGTTLDDTVLIDANGNELEQNGATFLTNIFGGQWLQTSYNTRGGVHYTDGLPSEDQRKALRFNYAGIGFTYDEERDAFIPPKPFDSWILNETTCLWESPTPYPEDGGVYNWDESTQSWIEMV